MTPTFLAPLMLAGAAAVAVPVALHFLYKPRYRPQPWAAMRFLKLSLQQTSKRIRFREWVLLALRCLALIVLAVALARPMGSTHVASVGEGIDAVVVIDCTLSMQAKSGVGTRFDAALAAARQAVEQLPGGSTVQVVAMDRKATVVGPRVPANLEDAKRVIAALTPTSLAGDLPAALQLAADTLARGSLPNKELYVVSDFQKSEWDRQSGALRALADELKDKATLTLVRAGEGSNLANVTLTKMTYPAGVPHTRSRLPVSVFAENTGRAPLKNLTVTLEVDGNAQEKESATIESLEPGQSVSLTLTARLEAAGDRLLTARVFPDSLAADNRLDLLVPVRDTFRVLLVDGAPDARDPRSSAGHYVRNALVPVPVDRQAEYHVQVTTVAATEATTGLVGLHDLVVLAGTPVGPGGLSAAFVSRLGEFVRAGGGLVIGTGGAIVPPAFNAAFGKTGANLLPRDLGAAVEFPAETPLQLAPESADPAGFLAAFANDPYRGATAEVELRQLQALAADAEPDSREELAASDRRPVVLSRRVGEGEVVLIATPLDATGGNWPARAGSYLSLWQLLVGRLATRTEAALNPVIGRAVVAKAPDANPAEWVSPSGRRAKLTPSSASREALRFVTPETSEAGVYRLSPAGLEPPEGPRYAVNFDADDAADLSSLSDDELAERLGFRPSFLAPGSGRPAEFALERSRREWTTYALLGLFAVALAEMVWAWKCGRASA